jgi:SAM-dependent methyltransferase
MFAQGVRGSSVHRTLARHISRIVAMHVVLAGVAGCAGVPGVPGRVVRYEPTPTAVVRSMLELAAVAPGDVVLDLGSGDGRIPITAAREFGARGMGVDIDAALVARARENARLAAVDNLVEFSVGDMYAADLRQATVVTLFLHPEPNRRLRPKLLSELRAGARVVSYMWDMDDWVPDETRRVWGHRIFLWTIPGGNDRTPVPVR